MAPLFGGRGNGHRDGIHHLPQTEVEILQTLEPFQLRVFLQC